MMPAALDFESQIRELIPRLTADQQRDILGRVQDMLGTGKPAGVPGSALLKFFGTISREDAEAMKRVIEEDCEQINPESW